MKYLLSIFIICISVMWIVTAFAVESEDSWVVVDRGYECFNLEIAQAQLTDARSHGSRWEIIKARRVVSNWEKLCGGE